MLTRIRYTSYFKRTFNSIQIDSISTRLYPGDQQFLTFSDNHATFRFAFLFQALLRSRQKVCVKIS